MVLLVGSDDGFWLDADGFGDVNHYSKGFFGSCAKFGVEIRVFSAKKRFWGPQI